MNESLEFISYNNNETNAMNLNITSDIPQDDLPPLLTFIYIIIGTIGNSLVCIAILLDRKLQNLTNYFLSSLAVTDLLVSILILPARMATVRFKFEPSTFPWCFLYLVGDDYITAASAIHICFISIERYFAIKDPLKQRSITKKNVAIKIGLVWLISFLTIIPYMTIAIITEHSTKTEYCSTLLSRFVFFDAIVFVEALVIVTMVVVVVASFIMTSILLHQLIKKQKEHALRGDTGLVRTVGGKKTDGKANNKKAQALQSEQKALRVVWLVSFAFMICMTPYTCTSFSYYFFPEVVIPPFLLEITAYLSYANSIVNPIIYTIFNKRFRNNFKNVILCKYKNI